MPKALIVVSDMEIDRCGDRNWMFYDHMKEKYEYCGYQLPNIIFWNVDSRNDIFHADSRRKRCPAIQRPVGYDIPESPEQY